MVEIINSPTLKTWNGKEMVTTGGQIILTLEAPTLVGADLSHRQLDWAYLPSTDLRRINFSRASLHGADLSGANLGGANFERTLMMGVNLEGADLADAYLHGAYLPAARLRAADLRFAILEDAKLRYARYDETTLWPEGFDPKAAGAKLYSEVKEWQL